MGGSVFLTVRRTTTHWATKDDVDNAADRFPPYDALMAADEALGRARFYPDAAAVKENASRRSEALKGLSVNDLRVMKRDDFSKFSTIIKRSGASYLDVEQFFARNDLPIEALIGDRGILMLNAEDERTLFKERYVEGMPSVKRTFAQHEPANDGKGRSEALCFVVGGSGSGKTFFALRKELRTFRNVDGLPHSATVYLKPMNLDTDVPDFKDPHAPEKLVASIRRLVEQEVQNYIRPSWTWQKLDMHLCLVLDEAGSSDLMGFFDKKQEVQQLIKEATRVLATSVVVVVCGTNISGSKFSSTAEAYFFRMTPWEKDDLNKLLEKKEDVLRLKPGESAGTVARAVFAQSMLAALATNARSAGFLIDAILDSCAGPRITWMNHLSFATPAIVSRVVGKYATMNGLSSLDYEQQPRLAAWVLARLVTMQKRSTELPEFDGLTDKEREVALSLLQINLEYGGGGVKLLRDELFPVSITPAIALVLFTMAGVPASVLAGWRAEEEVAALYAVREWIYRCWQEHSSALTAAQKEYGREAQKLSEFEDWLRVRAQYHEYDLERRDLERKFGDELRNLRLFRLDKQVRTVKEGDQSVKIPLLSSCSIAVNGDLAHFADVIAPFMLVQAKHTVKGNLVVDLVDELDKCGLLKDGKDDRALRGLLAIWGGTFDRYFQEAEGAMMRASDEETPPLTKEAFERSHAFPANLIKSGRFEDSFQYLLVEDQIGYDVEIDVSEGVVSLPAIPDKVGVDFILSTNAEALTLSLPGKVSIPITEGSLDEKMELDLTKLQKKTKRRTKKRQEAEEEEEVVMMRAEAWGNLKARVRDGVALKFLFTLHYQKGERGKRQGED